MAPVNATIYHYGCIVGFLVSTNSGGEIAPPVDQLKDFLKLNRAWRGGSMRPRRDKATHVMDFMKFFTPAITNAVKVVEDTQGQQHTVWDACYGSMSPSQMRSITRMSVEVKDPPGLTGKFLALPAAPPQHMSWAETERQLEVELRNEDDNFIVRPPPPPSDSPAVRKSPVAARNVQHIPGSRSVLGPPRIAQAQAKSTLNNVARSRSTSASTSLNKSSEMHKGVKLRQSAPPRSGASSRSITPELHSPCSSSGEEQDTLHSRDSGNKASALNYDSTARQTLPSELNLTDHIAVLEGREQHLQAWQRKLQLRARNLAQREEEMHAYHRALRTWTSNEVAHSLLQHARLRDVCVWISKEYQTEDFRTDDPPRCPGPRTPRSHPRDPFHSHVTSPDSPEPAISEESQFRTALPVLKKSLP